MDPDCLRRYTPLGLIFEGEGGAPGSGGTPTPPEPTDQGFPAGIPIADMTAEQQAAYWKFQSRKHEKVAESRKDFDKYKTDSEELARERAKNQTESERAVEEARRQGEQTGSSRYLKDAVAGHLRGITHKSAEDIAEALQFVDVKAFTASDGSLDTSQLDKFAKQLGGTPKQEPRGGSNHFDTLTRGNGSGLPRTGGSLADKRKATREALIPNRS